VEVHGQDSLGQVNIARYDTNTTVKVAPGLNRGRYRGRHRRSNGTREQQAEFVREALDIDDFEFSFLPLAEEDFGFRVAVRGD
jgi:hypothetical protein